LQNGYGDLAAHVAIQAGNRSILEILMKDGTDPEICNLKGETCLIAAINSNQMACIRVLKRFKTDFMKTDEKTSPLKFAVKNGDYEIIDYILKNGAPLKDQQHVWNIARQNFVVGEQVMAFNCKTGQNFKQFERLEEKDKKFLVKFSTAWDIEFAVNEKIDLHKMADLIRKGC